MFNTHRSYNLSTGLKGTTIAVVNSSPSDITIVYHRTMVVQKKGNTITLSNGGWDTVSTRIVINRALEQMCNSKAFLFRKKGATLLRHNGQIIPFVSGMTLKTSLRSAS